MAGRRGSEYLPGRKNCLVISFACAPLVLAATGTVRAEETANSIFVEAVRTYQGAEALDDPERLAALSEAKEVLQTIIDEFPSSDLAVQLISGQTIGMISMPGVEAEIMAICERAPTLCSDDPPAVFAARRALDLLLPNGVLVPAVVPAVVLARQGDTAAAETLVASLEDDPAAVPYLALLLNETGQASQARSLAQSVSDAHARYVSFVLIGALDEAKSLSAEISVDAMTVGTIQQALFLAQILGLAKAEEIASVLPDGEAPAAIMGQTWMMVGAVDRALAAYGTGPDAAAHDFNKVIAVRTAMVHGHLDAARSLADTVSTPGAAVMAHALALQPEKARTASETAESDPTYAAYLAAVTGDVDGSIAGISLLAVSYVPDLAGILAGSSGDPANVEGFLGALRSEVELGRMIPNVHVQAVINAANVLARRDDLAALDISGSVPNRVQQGLVLARVSAELAKSQ